MTTKKNKEFNFKIGADPEFILTMQGQKVHAKETMKLLLTPHKEFKPGKSDKGFSVGKFGEVGWDGADGTAELRPSPSNSPKEIVKNIAGILAAMSKHITICDMTTMSEFCSIGGHIHLEVAKGEMWSAEKTNTIHKRMSSFYLPLLISENKTNLSLRLKQGYGTLKDQRIEEHFIHDDGKPGYTYEFRSPSAEWLTTPKLAEATLAYMGTVYHEILNNPKNFENFNDLIYKNEKQAEALQNLAIMEFSLLTETIVKTAHKYIKTFEMYDTHKELIEYLFNPAQVIKDKQKANYDITQGWGFAKTATVPKKKQIMSTKKQIQKIASKEDFDALKKVMNIHYNDDTNVALFAESFKDRVAAFNWKLKNNYFIFGVRKGIDTIIAQNGKGEYLKGEEIIKTLLDKNQMDNLFKKMNTKFNTQNSGGNTITIDFATGKAKDARKKSILIGLPYKMRIEEDLTAFLNLIWSLETEETIKKSLKEEVDLINDLELPIPERGEIYKLLSNQVTTESERVILDQNSNSRDRHNNAVAAILQEQVNQF